VHFSVLVCDKIYPIKEKKNPYIILV
jgi:hypothetical protein